MNEWFAVHVLDIGVLLVLAWYAWAGWRRGFLAASLETVGFVAAMLTAAFGYRFVGAFIESRFRMPHSFADALGFFGLWCLIDILWPLAARRLHRLLPETWRQARANRAFGILPGIVNCALLLSVFLTVLLAFPLPGALKERVTDAYAARPLLAVARGFDRLFKPILGPAAETSVNLMTVRPASGDRVDLHFTVHDGAADPESEGEMLLLLNDERTKLGLVPLKADARLREVARAHSRDMFERGYFSHVNPDGLEPHERVERAGIPYGLMGENLALAPDVVIAHDGLMDSPGHRANILGVDFREVGIGVIDGDIYGKMFTQVFTD